MRDDRADRTTTVVTLDELEAAGLAERRPARRERAAFVAARERLVTGRLSAPVACERPVRRRAARAATVVS